MSSARSRMVLAIVGIVVVSLAFFFFFVRSRQGDLAAVREEVDAARNETQVLQVELQQLQALQQNAPALVARLSEIREAVPPDDDVANFIFQVNDAASKSGVDFVQITPELPKQPLEGAQVAEVRITIGARGGYFAVQDFIRRLYTLDRATRIDLLNLVTSENQEDDSTEVEMSGTARIFFELPPGGALPGGTETVPAEPVEGQPEETQAQPASE